MILTCSSWQGVLSSSVKLGLFGWHTSIKLVELGIFSKKNIIKFAERKHAFPGRFVLELTIIFTHPSFVEFAYPDYPLRIVL